MVGEVDETQKNRYTRDDLSKPQEEMYKTLEILSNQIESLPRIEYYEDEKKSHSYSEGNPTSLTLDNRISDFKRKSLIESISIKALLGDPDIDGNIAIKENKETYPYDLEMAFGEYSIEGTGTLQDTYERILENSNTVEEYNVSPREIRAGITEKASQLDLEEIKRKLQDKDLYTGPTEILRKIPGRESPSEQFIENVKVARRGTFGNNLVFWAGDKVGKYTQNKIDKELEKTGV